MFVKRGLTVYRLLITMIRIGNYLLARFHGGGGGRGRGRGRVHPIMAHTGRLRAKGVPFSGFRYMKGYGFN